jgi:CHAT domain-containing protein
MIDVAVSPMRIPAGVADLEIRLMNNGDDVCLNIRFVIRLPVGIMRLRGQDKITVPSLPPGGSVTVPLRVRADSAGRYQLTSPNFSYTDHTGRPHRETGFTAEILVDPEPAAVPEPKVTVDVRTAELPLDEWSTFRARVSNASNVGDIEVSELEIRLSGHVTPDNRSRKFLLERLPAGASVDASFFVRAQEAGAQVPVYLDLTYTGPRGPHHSTTTGVVSVRSHPVPGPMPAREPQPLVRVLFFGANPRGTQPLRVDEEIREIQQTIRQGRERDTIRVDTVWALRPRDVTQALIDFTPHFIHFAGHGGGGEGSFAAEDDDGYAHVIPVGGLVRAFKAVGGDVRCVIINACRTERLARALAAAVPWVIGMRQPVGDRSAIRFSIGFYQALVAGKSIETAFDVGVAQLYMYPEGDDALAPILLHGIEEAGSRRQGTDAH